MMDELVSYVFGEIQWLFAKSNGSIILLDQVSWCTTCAYCRIPSSKHHNDPFQLFAWQGELVTDEFNIFLCFRGNQMVISKNKWRQHYVSCVVFALNCFQNLSNVHISTPSSEHPKLDTLAFAPFCNSLQVEVAKYQLIPPFQRPCLHRQHPELRLPGAPGHPGGLGDEVPGVAQLCAQGPRHQELPRGHQGQEREGK